MLRTETHPGAPDSKPNCHQNCHSEGVEWWMVRDSTISPTDLTQEALRTRVRIHPKSGCWEYTGACDAHGYGRVFLSGKERKAPRVYFEVFVGPLPAGARLKHTLPSDKCIGSRCCNPAHVTVEQSFNEIKFARRICPKGHLIDADNAVVERRGNHLLVRCRACRRLDWKTNKRLAAKLRLGQQSPSGG